MNVKVELMWPVLLEFITLTDIRTESILFISLLLREVCLFSLSVVLW